MSLKYHHETSFCQRNHTAIEEGLWKGEPVRKCGVGEIWTHDRRVSPTCISAPTDHHQTSVPRWEDRCFPWHGVSKINSGDPLFIICEHKERKDRWSPSPFRARPQPLSRTQNLSLFYADCTKSR